MKRVIFLGTYDGFAYDPRSQRVAEALAEEYDFTIIAPKTGHPSPVQGVNVIDSKPLPGWAPGFLRLMSFWFQFLVAGLRRRPDIVYASDYYMAFPGWVLSSIIGAALIYDAHELILPSPGYPMSYRDGFFYNLEKWVVKRSAIVAAANAERAERMQTHYGLVKTPLVLRNISQSPVGDGEQPPLQPLTEGIVLVYQGDMNLERGVGLFVTALRLLDQRFQLLMVGDGPDLVALKRLAEQEGVSERIVFTGRLPRKELLSAIRRGHIGLVTYSFSGLNNILCAPNKIYDYPQAGLTVITTGHLPLRDILEKNPVGVWVGGSSSPPTPGDFALAVEHVADNLERYRSAIPAFLATHSWERDRASLRDAVQRLV